MTFIVALHADIIDEQARTIALIRTSYQVLTYAKNMGRFRMPVPALKREASQAPEQVGTGVIIASNPNKKLMLSSA